MVEHDRAVQAEFERDSAKADYHAAMAAKDAEIARLREGIQQIWGYCDFPDGHSTLFSERMCKMARALLKETP